MKRIGKVALALAASLSMVLAGCSSGSSGSSGGGSATSLDDALKAGGTITYWTWTPQAKTQVDAFQKEYPNVHVNLVTTSNKDQYTKLQNAIKAGTGAPDVAQIEY